MTSTTERLVVVGLTTAFVAGYLWLAWARGALGACRNDDWSYLRVAFDFWRNGRFTLTGFVQMTFVGQAALAAAFFAVFGPSIASAQIGVAILGGASVFASFVLLRSFLAFGWSVLICVMLLSGPLFGSLSVSFMTDVPSYAAQMLTLLLGWRATCRGPISMGWLVAAAAAGLCAMSIREFGGVAYGAVLIVALAKAAASRDHRRLMGVGATTGAMAVIAAMGLAWRHSLPHDMLFPRLAFHPGAALAAHAAGALSLALFLSPCVMALSLPRTLLAAWKRSRRWAALTMGLSLGALWLARVRFLGNYLTMDGSYPETTLRSVAPIVPPMAFLAARVIAAYALIILALVAMLAVFDCITVLQMRRRAAGAKREAHQLFATTSALPVVTAFVVPLVIAQLAAVVFVNSPLLDRYFLPLIMLGAGLTLRVAIRHDLLARGASLGFMLAGLLAFASLGISIIDASDTIDGSKWTLAARAQALGYAPEGIDGGFEWFGFHQIDSASRPTNESNHTWWTTMFPPRPICATVSIETPADASRMPGALATTTATTLFGQRLAFVLRPGPDVCAVPVVR